MDILNLDPKTFPKDDFDPPLGGMPMEDYEKWIFEVLRPNRAEIERNPSPPEESVPFIWKSA